MTLYKQDIHLKSDVIYYGRPCSNSKFIKNGDVFFSFPHENQDLFIKEALENGASKVVVDNARYLFSKALKKYNNGKQPKNIFAITGTNGKTSTAYFVYQLLKHKNHKVAYVGTIGFLSSEKFIPKTDTGKLTTPGAYEIHSLAKELYENNFDSLVIEASSHGLDQYRIHGLDIESVSFLNITQDHLDYHKTMDSYFESKKKLISDFSYNTGVINGDDKYISTLKKDKPYLITFGFNEGNNYKIEKIDKNKVSLKINSETYSFYWNNIGDFQVMNVIAAIAMISKFYKISEIVNILSELKAPPGRMECVNISKGTVIIDFAHTPDALEKALMEVKKIALNKIWTIFGCGGDRDNSKRELMGKIADKYSDKLIITNDNPRFENPQKIFNDIKSGIKSKNYKCIEDRESAIKYAITNMEEGDIILIAGKGHENNQVINGKNITYNDKKVVELFTNNTESKNNEMDSI